MSDSVKENDAIEKEELKKFNYTMGGKADEIGFIAKGSADNPESLSDPNSKKNKKKANEAALKELEAMLHDQIARLEVELFQLRIEIDCGRKLIDAFENGERDFENQLYLDWFEKSGLTKDDVLSGNAKEILAEKELAYEQGSHKLTQLKLGNHHEKPDTIQEIRADAEFSENELSIIESEGFDGSFEGAFDDDLTTTSIKTDINLKSAFDNASNPIQPDSEPQSPTPESPTIEAEGFSI